MGGNVSHCRSCRNRCKVTHPFRLRAVHQADSYSFWPPSHSLCCDRYTRGVWDKGAPSKTDEAQCTACAHYCCSPPIRQGGRQCRNVPCSVPQCDISPTN